MSAYLVLKSSAFHTPYFSQMSLAIAGSGLPPSSPGRRQKHTFFQPGPRTCSLPFRENCCLRHLSLQIMVLEEKKKNVAPEARGKSFTSGEIEMSRWWVGPGVGSGAVHPEVQEIWHLLLPGLSHTSAEWEVGRHSPLGSFSPQSHLSCCFLCLPSSPTLPGKLLHNLRLKCHFSGTFLEPKVDWDDPTLCFQSLF